MRIGMLADIYKPHISGVTNVIELSQQVLASRGHEVCVFTFGDEQPEDEKENVFRSAGIPIPIREPTIQLNFRYTDRAQRKLATMDIVHVHHPFLSGRMALRYADPLGIPIVFTNHTRYDLYAKAYLPMMPDQISTTFLQAYLPAFCREVDLVIAPSDGLKRVLRELDVSSEIEVIPNGVDLAPIRQASSAKDREALGFSPEDVLLIYSGRLGPEKNLTFLLRAFAGLQRAFDNTGLILLGKGPEMENLKDYAKRSGLEAVVRFEGLVPYTQVPDYLAMADVFVTASVTEVHPLSVIEAMAAGLPVVGVESPGVGDIVNHGENGFLSSEDLASYSSLLTRIVAEDQTRKRLSQGAIDSVRQYDIQRTTSLLEERYKELIAQKREGQRGPLRRIWSRFTSGAHE